MMLTPAILLAAALAQPGAPAANAPPLDWQAEEAWLLSDHTQITFPTRFAKAGEAYFDHETPPRWIIFQAVPAPEDGQQPSPHYSMYVARLDYYNGRITGIERPILISPDGSANTCGWFHPTQPARVLFGSTLAPPAADDKSGFQVGTRKYTWQFPVEMDVVTRTIMPMWDDPDAYLEEKETLRGLEQSRRLIEAIKEELRSRGEEVPEDPNEAALLALSPPDRQDKETPQPLFERPRYDAEASWSPDGRSVLYAHIREAQGDALHDADIWIYDTTTEEHTPLVQADGYDGGPFFSPDGTWICYRSDRRGDNQLQLFIAELAFDEGGAPEGIKREIQLTDNSHVNWAPFWHPSSRDGKGVLVYATSEAGHHNYEVFAIEADPEKPADELRRKRLTVADGFDGLPVFSADGEWMMWTSQRGTKADDEERPSSQIWVARVKPGLFGSPDLFRDADRDDPEGD